MAREEQDPPGHTVTPPLISARQRRNILPRVRHRTRPPAHHPGIRRVAGHNRLGQIYHGDGLIKTPPNPKRIPPPMQFLPSGSKLDIRSDNPASPGNTFPMDLSMRPGARLHNRYTHLIPQGGATKGD